MESRHLELQMRIMLGRLSMMLAGGALATVMAGCSGGIDREQVAELIQSKPVHQLPVSDRHVSNVKVEHQQGSRWKVEFECLEIAAVDWLAELDLAVAEQELAASRAAFNSASEQVAQVRWPEREPLLAKKREIDDFTLPRLFRPAAKAGEEVNWRGAATIIDDENGMKIASVTVASPSPIAFDSLTVKREIGEDAAVSDGGSADPIVKTRELHAAFDDLVNQAEDAVATRLMQERTALNSLASGEKVVAGPMVTQTNTAPMVAFQFEAGGEDIVNAVAIDSQDTFSRVVFDGRLSLPPTPVSKPRVRTGHDGWRIELKNADAQLSPLSRKIKSVISVSFDTGSGQFLLSDQTHSSPLTETPAATGRPVAKRLAELQHLGAQAKGTESISGLADRQVAMTVTQFDESTGNLRVLFEDESSPFTFAVFEGKFRTQSPHHLGLPIQLKQVANAVAPDRSAKDSLLFTRGSNYVLTLLPTEKGFIGKYRTAELTLGEVTTNEQVAEGSARWRNFVKAGSTWRGFTQLRADAVQEVTLRVAEVREEGKYVRFLFEKNGSPLDFVVYEGSWNQTDGRIDGYSLVTLQKGSNTNYDHDYFGVFFSEWESNDTKLFRLSADGETLYGLTKGGEVSTLKRDETVGVSETYTTDAMTKTWPIVLQVGREWKGQYTNVRIKKTTNIMMKIVGYELDGKRVTVEVTAEADARVKGIYQGSVNLSDPKINGFTLTLEPQKGSLSKITLFDASWEANLELRFDAANARLIGRSKNYQGLFSHMNLKSGVDKGEKPVAN